VSLIVPDGRGAVIAPFLPLMPADTQENYLWYYMSMMCDVD
jgi:hypothetical protein